MPKKKSLAIIPDERIIGKIYFIRGEKVMFDRDLAALYGVETKALNQAVKRNAKRFPSDFMFRLNKQEATVFLRFQNGILNDENGLRSQIVTSKNRSGSRSQIVTLKRGGLRYEPYVFTEQGIAMLSSVLNSDRAIQVNIQIMRTFTKMRSLLISNKGLREKVEAMERKYDKDFGIVFKVIAKFLKTDIPNQKGEIKIAGFGDRK